MHEKYERMTENNDFSAKWPFGLGNGSQIETGLAELTAAKLSPRNDFKTNRSSPQLGENAVLRLGPGCHVEKMTADRTPKNRRIE